MNDGQFRLTEAEGGTPTVVSASGEIDLANVGKLKELIACAVAASPTITLDLAAVTYCDSSTVRALFDVAAATKLTVVIRETGPLKKLLSISGLDRVSDIVTVGHPPTATDS